MAGAQGDTFGWNGHKELTMTGALEERDRHKKCSGITESWHCQQQKCGVMNVAPDHGNIHLNKTETITEVHSK